MFAKGLARRREGGDLYARIGEVLRAQGLGPDPINYAFAHHLVVCEDAPVRQTLERLTVDGIRLNAEEIAAMGGAVAAGPLAIGEHRRAPAEPDAAADRLAGQMRSQVEAVAGMMRAMHHETVGFGRDLAQSAAALGSDDASVSAGEVVRLTRGMIERVAAAEAKLDRAAAETDALRAELAEAQVAARHDPLTGLPNRRAFDEAFAVPATGARCLALCDIDHFKRINDRFGHAVGDRVLSAVARILADRCAGHLVTRQGGEEFAVLIAGSDLAAAHGLLDAARAAVSARRFRARDNDSDVAIGQVTFSAGMVAVEPGEDAGAALVRADQLLYRAKAAGRDRVIAA